MSRIKWAAALAVSLLLPATSALASTIVIGASVPGSNAGFESDQLNGMQGTRTGTTSGSGGSDRRFAVTGGGGTITVDGWVINSSGFGGLDGSQINDFTTPPPSNGQDGGNQRGRGDSFRALIANQGVTLTALSDDVGSGLAGDAFDVSFWTAQNQSSGTTTVTYSSGILFDAGLASENFVAFADIVHAELDAPNGTLADNTTTGFIFRDLAPISAPADYTTAQLEIEFLPPTTVQAYVDDVELSVTPVPEPTAIALGLLGVVGLIARRR